MAKTNFDSKWAKSAGETITAAGWFNDPGEGIQDEFEERGAAIQVAGVVSGLAASIDGADIDIAAGDGYGAGKRYKGGESITFSASDTAATYYVYWDSSAEALAKSTTAPDTAQDILFCSAAWNGTDTLSSLVDLRPWGLLALPLIDGVCSLTTVTTGLKYIAPVPVDCWIDAVQIVQSSNGSSGSTIVDVLVGDSGSSPTTCFADTSRRPTLTASDAAYTVATSGVPDTHRKVTAGQVLTVTVSTVSTDSQDLGVTIYGRAY